MPPAAGIEPKTASRCIRPMAKCPRMACNRATMNAGGAAISGITQRRPIILYETLEALYQQVNAPFCAQRRPQRPALGGAGPGPGAYRPAGGAAAPGGGHGPAGAGGPGRSVGPGRGNHLMRLSPRRRHLPQGGPQGYQPRDPAGAVCGRRPERGRCQQLHLQQADHRPHHPGRVRAHPLHRHLRGRHHRRDSGHPDRGLRQGRRCPPRLPSTRAIPSPAGTLPSPTSAAT